MKGDASVGNLIDRVRNEGSRSDFIAYDNSPQFMPNSDLRLIAFAIGAFLLSLSSGHLFADANDIDERASKDMAESSDSQQISYREYINTWLILGAFSNDSTFETLEKTSFEKILTLPRIGQKLLGSEWRYFDDRLFSRNYDDYQDLYSYFKIKRSESVAGKIVYAHSYIFSEKEVSAELRLGADTDQKSWLNGELIQFQKKDAAWKRDSFIASVTLRQGWNRLLVRVSNRIEGRFGFYARFSDAAGESLPNLTYSVSGPVDVLAIATSNMPDAKTDILPTAWREWPYVGAHPSQDINFYTKGDPSSPLWNFVTDKNMMMQASDFRFLAEGGIPPYYWGLAGGELPPGLTLKSDGRIIGTIANFASLKKYAFTVRMNDSEGKSKRKEFSIEVRERPNKWLEQARLDALIHGPENTPNAEFANAVANLMRRQGYQLGMPITYNNGENPAKFRWPSSFAENKTAIPDSVGMYKTALEAHGIKFGMYMGNLNERNRYTADQQNPFVEEAIRLYAPKTFWFDWALKENISVDSLYSMIRTLDPSIVIILNGHERGGSNGDWDIMCFEGWGAWGENLWTKNTWPIAVPWPKKHSPETWMLITHENKKSTETAPDSRNVPSDWKEYLRAQISIIGEGFIANIDHSPRFEKQFQTPFESDEMQCHMAMANWANPDGIPPLYSSYTQVDLGPLAEGDWGYNLINTTRDIIYLHLLKNPQGKKGMPQDGSITVCPIEQKIKTVTWMNKNKKLSFTQRSTSTDQSATISLDGVSADPIDTIIKIELKQPLPGPQAPQYPNPVPSGNLAYLKPARFLSIDGTSELRAAGPHRLASNGVDGKNYSYCAGGAFWYTYEVNLQRVYRVNKVEVNFSEDGVPKQYEIQGSADHVRWGKLAESLQNNRGGGMSFNFGAADVQFIRIIPIKTEPQSGTQMKIRELQVYQTES